MKRRWLVVLVFLALTVSFVYAGSGVDFKEGKWEITSSTEVTGMPMKIPSQTHTQCMKKASPVPHQKQPNQECETVDVKTSGNTVTYTMVCNTPGGKMTGKGKITYSGETMAGGMDMQMQGMSMVSKFSGRYIGQCD
ncbi:MAG: DUF3617 family protein [Desulfatitalea sp.]|nr:DUF3617 domain-containing protein [Desulfatitalea sp.]NNK01491.1 DUF3617 family protein [Desulfatitalea sp.]